MLFKSARRDGVVTEDSTEFVETVRRERRPKNKRPFTLPELRSVLDQASNEWRSMILFGLCSGQRLGDLATLRWNNIDLACSEQRLSTQKTEKTMILPLAQPLRKHIESLSAPGDPSAPLHPKAFDLLERHHNTGNLSNQFADLLAAAGLRQKRKRGNTKVWVKAEGAEEMSNHCHFTACPGLHYASARGRCSSGRSSGFNRT
jgi:integrase